jgi:hypothetical protein
VATRAKAVPKKGAGSDFLTVTQLAERLGVADTKTIDKRIAAGSIPPPWVWLAARTRAWRADHYKEFHDTGEWPKAAWKGVR